MFIKLGALGSSLFILALILNGCAGAGGGSGMSSGGAPPTDLVNGALPGPPTDGGSSPPPDVASGSPSNIVSGPPPDSLQISGPGTGISDDSSATNSNSSSPESETPKSNTRGVLAVLNISSISVTDPNWRKSWLSSGSDKLSDKAPQWLIPHTSDQPATEPYSVRYWNPDWQSFLDARIKATNRAGFSGVCLAGCNDYTAAPQEPQAAQEMTSLIVSLAEDAHSRNPKFAVVPMGAESLLESMTEQQKQQYLDAVDGRISTNP